MSDDMPMFWWSPTIGLIRGGTNGGYDDAVRLVRETDVQCDREHKDDDD